MALDLATVNRVLAGVSCPGGGDLLSRDLVRALSVEGETVRFVLEAASAGEARGLAPAQAAAEAALRAAGASAVQIVMTAHGPAGRPAPKAPALTGPEGQPPSLKIGQHPTAHQGGPQPIAGMATIIVVGSGMGGVGKSTVSSNLAVALARQGRRVGLLDADIFGYSIPGQLGITTTPTKVDELMLPPIAFDVKVISIGFFVAGFISVIDLCRNF